MQPIFHDQVGFFFFLVKFRIEYVLEIDQWSQNDNVCETLKENNYTSN